METKMPVITLKQLPIIEEHLQLVKAGIETRTKNAMQLVCTEETRGDVKKIRTELGKEFASMEEQRKRVKEAIMEPYNQFEAVYKDCISDPYKKADSELKRRIDEVEAGLKADKVKAVQSYFDELCKANNLPWLRFEQMNLSQTSQYKEQRTKNKEQNITTTTAQARESWQQCVDCYEQNIGALPRAAFDSIVGYLEQVEPDLVCEAINQAAINNKRSWGYAQAILRDCLKNNITTRAAYLAEKEARSQQKGATQRQQMKTTQEKLREIAKGGIADDVSADGGAPVAGYELLG